MSIALTIGIMLVILGYFDYMKEHDRRTIIDDICHYGSYITIGIIVLLCCFVHYLIMY